MTVLRVVVIGKPAPKGSMRSVGRGVMINQLKTTKPWGDAIIVAAAQARDLAGWEMLTGAVAVECVAIVPRPKSVKREYPITRSSGDGDKLARNLLDALVSARIMHDDSQVIDLHILKFYPRWECEEPGMYVTVSQYGARSGADARNTEGVA